MKDDWSLSGSFCSGRKQPDRPGEEGCVFTGALLCSLESKYVGQGDPDPAVQHPFFSVRDEMSCSVFQ